MDTLYRGALDELGGVLDRLDDTAVNAVIDRIAAAGRIAVFGCGREKLQIMGLAMRLYHMGLDAHVTGEMTTPPLGAGDLFLVTAGPGELATAIALMDVARAAGAEVVLVTAEPESTAARKADLVLHIPAQTMASDQAGTTSTLPMGSLYEGALFLVFEVMVLRLRDKLGITPEAMRTRHTNLE